MSREEGLFILENVDEKYYEGDLIQKFGLDPRKPIADGYGHFMNCDWFVQEVEGSDIDWAVDQLKSTVEQLEHLGRNVSKIFLVIKTAFKSKQYESKRGVLHVRGSKTPYLIRGKHIYVIKDAQIKKGGGLWLY